MPKPHSISARPATEAEELWLKVLVELENELIVSEVVHNEDERSDALDSEAPDDDVSGSGLSATGMWHAPAQLPPMPETLRARATALHELQLQRQQELQAERAQVGKHLDALSSVPRPRSGAASVYLDVAG